MTDDYEYDEERAIWRPGRRSFLFMLGGAMAGILVPKPPDLGPWNVGPITEGAVGYRSYADLLVETFTRDRVFAPFERAVSPFHRATSRIVNISDEGLW